jgi:hypothetical protein
LPDGQSDHFFKRSHKIIVALTASWRLGASVPPLARPQITIKRHLV